MEEATSKKIVLRSNEFVAVGNTKSGNEDEVPEYFTVNSASMTNNIAPSSKMSSKKAAEPVRRKPSLSAAQEEALVNNASAEEEQAPQYFTVNSKITFVPPNSTVMKKY